MFHEERSDIPTLHSRPQAASQQGAGALYAVPRAGHERQPLDQPHLYLRFLVQRGGEADLQVVARMDESLA